MKTSRGWLLIIGVEFVAVSMCLGILYLVFSTPDLAEFLPAQSARSLPTETAQPPTRTPAASPTATLTETPAPTYTRVIPPLPPDFTPPPLVVASRTPTRAPIPYGVVVPTPTAPAMVYPIRLESSLSVITYPVTGKTINDLRRSLEAQALPDPNDPNGRFYARTDYSIAAQWSVQPSTRGCEVESGTITLVMTMTLPAASTAGMAADVQKTWTTFISNTITHEDGHVTRNYQGANTLQHDLGNALPAADCTTIKPQLDNVFTRSSDALRQSNVDYDTATQHGAKQGAVFP